MTRNQKSANFNEFISSFEHEILSYPCWVGASLAEIEESSEALEYLLTKQTHTLIFMEDPRDEQLLEAYQTFEFVKPKHLEICEDVAQDCLVEVAIDRKA